MRDPSTRWVRLGAVALVVLAPLAIGIGVIAPRSARRAALEARLDRALVAFRAQRWERPVLRGPSVEGNAHDAQVEAMGALGTLDTSAFAAAMIAAGILDPSASSDFHDQLEARRATTLQTEWIAHNREALARYRASTQRAWSWGEHQVELSSRRRVAEYRHLYASRMLLVSAFDAEPAECLAICADVLRLGQDRAAGTGLAPLMMLAVQAEDVLPVAARCLREADEPTLRRATRELAILARHPAPTGSAMELEALLSGATLRDEARATPLFPTDSAGWERWRLASDTIEAWDLLMGDPAAERTIGRNYPADLDRVAARQRDLASRGNEVIAMMMPDYARHLRRDAATRAIVRLLWAAARARLEHAETSDSRPALLDDPELVDPTTGHPFVWRRDEHGAAIESRRPAALEHGELRVEL